MTSSRQVEIERKYDVDHATILPSLADADGVASIRQPVEHQMEAVYFDTPELDLARKGITLRRRTGGGDDGWHVKLPGDKDTRTELRAPLGRAVRTVPARLLAPVRAVVRDRPLAPVARVATRRLEYALIGDDSTVLAHVCDDQVRAERLDTPVTAREWREWEVELVDGAENLLDAVEEHLLAAGAARATTASKLSRTLADAVPAAPPRPSRKSLAKGSTAQLLLAHLSEHTARMHRQDAGVRADRPEAVHKLRISARRLRSALTTYRPLFEAGHAEPLRDELRWLGQTLSGARDAQVLREHLVRLLSSEPTELVLGPVVDRIEDELGNAYRAGREQALLALESERYFRLLDALDEVVRSAPLTEEADAPAKDVVPRLLRRDAKRLRRAVRRIEQADDAQQRDLALHEARKKAKRLRYAAESAVPVFGKRAKVLAGSAEEVQESLGLHQDSVVARQKLRDFGVRAHLSGENGFTFGRLHALEQWRADQAEKAFAEAWETLRHQKPHRWTDT
jgi:CHAD domain-containing protein